MDDRELQIGILLLLADGRQHADVTIANLQNRLCDLALIVSHLDAM